MEDWNARSGYSRDGRIHGTLKTLGTVTGRTAATQPNVQQVSGDKEGTLAVATNAGLGAGRVLTFRSRAPLLWPTTWHPTTTVPMLMILNGDIHTANQNAAGLETRDQAKTFIYALIYGGGNGKIGEHRGWLCHKGGKLKDTFFKNMPALKTVIEDSKMVCRSRRRDQAAGRTLLLCAPATRRLNVLLQGAGAVISKKWCIICNERVRGWPACLQIGFIHDEMQWECHPDDAERSVRSSTASSVSLVKSWAFVCVSTQKPRSETTGRVPLMKRIYIAGCMSGLPNNGYDAFNARLPNYGQLVGTSSIQRRWTSTRVCLPHESSPVRTTCRPLGAT